jgi:hypothetical protein
MRMGRNDGKERGVGDEKAERKMRKNRERGRGERQ